MTHRRGVRPGSGCPRGRPRTQARPPAPGELRSLFGATELQEDRPGARLRFQRFGPRLLRGDRVVADDQHAVVPDSHHAEPLLAGQVAVAVLDVDLPELAGRLADRQGAPEEQLVSLPDLESVAVDF